MAGIINQYANDLLEYAKEQNELEDFYNHAQVLVKEMDWSGIPSIPNRLVAFLLLVPKANTKPVLRKFIDVARDELGLLDVTVISAVPLSDQQIKDVEKELARIFNRKIQLTAQVDSSLLGGLRIVAGYTVIDNTIKRKILDMKKNIYKGVYFKQ
jgi:F-type H+-transporting ATPase subunit delta